MNHLLLLNSKKISNINKILRSLFSVRQISDKKLDENSIIMCKETNSILCYHPEKKHPFEFSREIQRKIENESALSSDLVNLYMKRFDSRPARNPDEQWANAIRLSKEFHEHPIKFKRPNREERIKKFLEKTNPTKKNRESI